MSGAVAQHSGADRLSMVLAIVLGVILAVMRLSPNPVFRSVSWVYLWIFRGTPVYVQLVFWGWFPTIYKNIQLGIPFGPTVRRVQHAASSNAFLLAMHRPRPQRGRLHGRDHPRRHQLGAAKASPRRRPRWGCRGGMTMRRTVLPQAMRVIIPPTGNEFISMLKTTSLVTAVPFTLDLYGAPARHRRRELPAGAAAARRGDLVPGGHEHPDGRAVLPGAVLLAGSSRKLTSKQLETLAKAQDTGIDGGADGSSGAVTPMVKAERSARVSARLHVLKGITLEVGRGRCCAWSARRVRASRRSCAASTTSRRSPRATAMSTAS